MFSALNCLTFLDLFFFCQRFVDYEVPEPYNTYCFKSRVMSEFLYHNSQLELSRRARVVMWSDASTRFMQDPALWSRRVLRDELDFVARYTSWNVPGQTHRKTFEFFGLMPSDFKDFPSIAATHFLVNLERESIRKVLQKWVDCGVSCLIEFWPVAVGKLKICSTSIIGTTMSNMHGSAR